MSADNRQKISATDAEKRILELCEEHKEGITENLMTLHIPNLTAEMKMQVLNKLMKTKLKVLQGANNELLFKLKDPVGHNKLKDADKEEKRVFQYVKQRGSHGAFVKDMKKEIALTDLKIAKILERLAKKNLVKSVVNAKKPKQKCYLLASLEPDSKITGGIFYSSDHKFETGFVEALMNVIRLYLEGKQRAAEKNSDDPMAYLSSVKATTKEVLDHIISVDVVKNTTLKAEDTEKLLNALELDGVVESSYSGDVKLWRCIPDWSPTLTLDRTPCGVCPKIEQCDDIGDINPESCRYLEEWLL